VDYDDTPEEAAFRARLRQWLAGHDPGPPPSIGDSEAEHAYKKRWHQTLYRGGWVGLSWPSAYGGHELSPIYEAIFNEELGAAGVAHAAPPVGWLGRAILAYGTEEQRRRHLPGLLSGETSWCQGFSEPGAGSDLASLRTLALRDGDTYRLNGQKLWTSGAQFADWCLLLARTDRDAPKHKGISAFTLDMRTPGITVRPMKQAWGGTRFCEVFFDDARVPVGDRIGDEGAGWPLATVVLAYERGPSELGAIATYRAEVRHLARAITGDPVGEDALARAYVAVEACRLHLLESLTRRAKGEAPGPGSSVDKLLMIRAEQALGALALDAGGLAGLTGDDWEVPSRYLWSRAASVYGGSEQIQRNIIAQRVLGLPRR
jgi:alkylation response protein AidB-like acyl-CoA dehydrogenase